MKKIISSLPFKLLLGVIMGILVGQVAGESILNIVVTVKYILNQIIVFCVPLIIIGFIAPSITRLGNNASKMLGSAVSAPYISSSGAALFSMTADYILYYRSWNDVICRHFGCCASLRKKIPAYFT